VHLENPLTDGDGKWGNDRKPKSILGLSHSVNAKTRRSGFLACLPSLNQAAFDERSVDLAVMIEIVLRIVLLAIDSEPDLEFGFTPSPATGRHSAGERSNVAQAAAKTSSGKTPERFSPARLLVALGLARQHHRLQIRIAPLHGIIQRLLGRNLVGPDGFHLFVNNIAHGFDLGHTNDR